MLNWRRQVILWGSAGAILFAVEKYYQHYYGAAQPELIVPRFDEEEEEEPIREEILERDLKNRGRSL